MNMNIEHENIQKQQDKRLYHMVYAASNLQEQEIIEIRVNGRNTVSNLLDRLKQEKNGATLV
jgi:hypothetical protein